MKKKFGPLLVSLGVLVLALITIFTAYRLYQLRGRAVAPTAPESKPGAGGLPTKNVVDSCTALTFSIGTPTPTPTGTAIATATPTPTGTAIATATPTPTPTPTPTGTAIATTTPTGTATATATATASSTSTPGGTSTPTTRASSTPGGTSSPKSSILPTSTPLLAKASPTGEPKLPEAGVSLPTLLGAGVGILLIVWAFALAL